MLCCDISFFLKKSFYRRYASSNYDTTVRNARKLNEDWFVETLKPFEKRHKRTIDEEEDKQMASFAEKAPMPSTVSGFKNHPLYALER